MSFHRKILVFYFCNSIGYSLTALATFLLIEPIFERIEYLGLALTIRTISSCIVGYSANWLIPKINIRNSFLLTYICGIISIILIMIGFQNHNILEIFIGITLIGLPSTLTSILLTIILKLSSKNNDDYLNFSGRRELIFSIARLLSCLLAPLLLLWVNIYSIILINFIACCVSMIVFFKIDFKFYTVKRHISMRKNFFQIIFGSKQTWIYIYQIVSSLLLISLIPLISSSDKIAITEGMPVLFRQFLWSIEAFTMVLGSSLYLLIKSFRKSLLIKILLMMNSGILLIITKEFYTVFIAVTVISLLMMISFYTYRDEYILGAGNNAEIIEAYASFSSIMKDMVCSISPGLLTTLFSRFSYNNAIWILFLIQVFLSASYFFIMQPKSLLSFNRIRNIDIK